MGSYSTFHCYTLSSDKRWYSSKNSLQLITFVIQFCMDFYNLIIDMLNDIHEKITQF